MVVGITHLAKDVKGGELRLRLLAQHGNCFVFYLQRPVGPKTTTKHTGFQRSKQPQPFYLTNLKLHLLLHL